MDYNKLKTLSEWKKISIRQMCTSIGITQSGLWKMTENQSMRIETLEKICNFYDVPISYFFPNMENRKNIINGNNDKKNKQQNDVEQMATTEINKNQTLISEIEYLKQIIEEKKEIIGLLKQKIEKLEGK